MAQLESPDLWNKILSTRQLQIPILPKKQKWPAWESGRLSPNSLHEFHKIRLWDKTAYELHKNHAGGFLTRSMLDQGESLPILLAHGITQGLSLVHEIKAVIGDYIPQLVEWGT